MMEIVVENYAIHIVVLHNIRHYFANLSTDFRERRIEDSDVTTFNQPFWVGIVIVKRVILTVSSIGRSITIRIEPYMYLYTTCVRRVNNELEWIVGRFTTTSASKVLTPWLIFRFVHSIRKATNLEEDGIEIGFLM